MIQQKVINGFNAFNLYMYYYSLIMLNKRYKYISNKLLKRYVVFKYLTTLGYKNLKRGLYYDRIN